MKIKMAEHIEIYLCDHCASVHIGLYRNGQLFAEAIPNHAEIVLEELTAAVAESQKRQRAAAGKGH